MHNDQETSTKNRLPINWNLTMYSSTFPTQMHHLRWIRPITNNILHMTKTSFRHQNLDKHVGKSSPHLPDTKRRPHALGHTFSSESFPQISTLGHSSTLSRLRMIGYRGKSKIRGRWQTVVWQTVSIPRRAHIIERYKSTQPSIWKKCNQWRFNENFLFLWSKESVLSHLCSCERYSGACNLKIITFIG